MDGYLTEFTRFLIPLRRVRNPLSGPGKATLARRHQRDLVLNSDRCNRRTMPDQLNGTTRGPLSELLLNIHAAIFGSDLQLIVIGSTVHVS